ncbi:MAG: ABC transporter substrate-binding protein [Pseudomonadota bacterium]
MKKKISMVYLRLLSTWFLVIIMLFGITGSAHSARPPGVTEDTIKVGIIYDQTGPVANLLVPITKGIRSLFRHTNEQGGIHGRRVKALVEDDRATIPMAISAFKKLIYRDGVVSLFGPSSSAATFALFNSIDKEKVPTIAGGTAERMVNPFQRYIFIVQDTSPGQMKVIVDYIIKDLNAKNPRIGFVYPDNEAGKTELESALERLKFYNLEPATKEVLNFGTIEATSQVLNLKKVKVDHIIMCGHISQSAIVLLREMKKFGLKVPVFGNWVTCNEEVMSIGNASDQFYSVNAMASWYDEGPGVAKMREITLKYEPGTEKPYRGKFYTCGWVTALVKIEGLRRAGRNLDGEALIKGLEGIKDLDMGGLTAPINYSPTNHKGGNAWKIFKSNPSTGKFIPMTEWRSPE